MSGLVSARPEAMRDYVLGVRGRREDAEEVRAALVRAHDDFLAALPGGLPGPPPPDLPDVAGPLARSGDVDAYVTTVADRFEDAGSAGSDGVYTMDAALLGEIPYTSQYSEARRRRLRERAEDELARLRETMGSGLAGETTTGELVATLGWMRFEIDRAPTPEAKREVAGDLIDTMGAGDVEVMLGVFEGELDRGTGVDVVRSYLEDLAVVTSWGLEGQPGRAERWAGRLSDDQDWYHDGPPEMLVALGALVAPGTAVLGTAVWRQVWGQTYMPTDQGTVPAFGHRAGEGGVLDRMFGSRNAIEVLAGAAGDRPEMANAIVMDTIRQGPEGFEHLFAQGGTRNPALGGDGTYDALGRMLTASVDVRLPLDDRLLAASQTVAMYDHVLQDGPVYLYADPIQEALGHTTQPLLANLTPDLERVWLPGLDYDDPANPPVGHLEHVIRDLAGSDAGTAGLGHAVEGATTELIYQSRSDAVANRSPGPLDDATLRQAGQVMDWVVGSVVHDRVDDLVSAVEGGGWDAGVQTALLEGIGATPYEPVTVVVDSVLAAQGQQVVPEAQLFGDDPEIRLTYHLVLANLAARPDAFSPELVQGLQAAANPSQAGAPGGVDGIYDFLQATRTHHDGDYPGLAELRQLVNQQRTAIGAQAPSLLADAFGLG